MNYQTFLPNQILASLVKFYWTLEVPFDPNNQKQKIIPDGSIEMTFNLGDKIKRYISETNYIFNDNAMVMGQRTKSYYIEPTGHVDTFAICFYPHGFANFISTPLFNLVDKETPIEELFDKVESVLLTQNISQAIHTQHRIEIIEAFLLKKLNEASTIETIVKTTVDVLLSTKGSTPINVILKDDLDKRRQLERYFKKQIGLSPKQLGKVIRLQATLQMMLSRTTTSMSDVAYEHEYFDQAHFIKDFKEFVGITPKEFLGNESMALSSLFYK
jgi:methylphosphotriester-DNA--protein-cysteine methyltransferase